MAVRVAFKVTDAAVRTALAKLTQQVANLRPAMAEIGSALVARTLMRFEGSFGPNGVPWKPVSRATAKRKARAGRTKLLIWSGRLRNSITYQAGAAQVAVGSNVRYAAIHQLGGSIEIAARSQKAKWGHWSKTEADTEGNRTTRKGFGFVKAGRKKFTKEGAVEIGAHTITEPARPFLPDGNDAGDRAAINDILTRRLKEAFA